MRRGGVVNDLERSRAKALYLKTQTAHLRDRVTHCEERDSGRWKGPTSRRQLAAAREELARAEAAAAEIFDAVLRGEVEP